MKLKPIVTYMIVVSIIVLLGCGIFFTLKREGPVQPLNVPQLLKEWVENTSTVGIATGLVDNGTIHYYAYGKKSIDSDEPVTEKTVFEIGSITKVFTTLLLMDMVNEGIIGLDDPIDRSISEITIPEKNGKKITFRHLASHTSGLPRLPTNFNITNPANPYANYSKKQLYEILN